jgi:protein-S-isoprenylcysteine O-methyltransferase Ste14
MTFYTHRAGFSDKIWVRAAVGGGRETAGPWPKQLSMSHWLTNGLDAAALVYALLLFPGPIFWMIIHPAIRFWRRFGTRSYWIALPLWATNAAFLLLLRERIFATRIERTTWTWLAGAALVSLAFWIDHEVGQKFTLRRLVGMPEMDPGCNPRGVVRSGIYARIRHPRYTACMMTFWGLAFLTGARGIFLLAILTVVMYLMVTPIEERELRNEYGSEYDSYAQAVPRFLPRLRKTAEIQPGN